MPLQDDKLTSFIIRIWREGGRTGETSRVWRGSIEQVESGNKSYFQDLEHIREFLSPFIEALGVQVSESGFWDEMNQSSILPGPEKEQKQSSTIQVMKPDKTN